MPNLRLIALCLFFMAGTADAKAQVDHRFNNWFTYFGQYKLSSRWGMHFDGQFRADDQVERINQSLLRLGGQYYLRPATTYTLGYAFVNTYSNSAGEYFTEHRIWQQFMHAHPLGASVSMAHRFRFENRFVERAAQKPETDWAVGYRFRYFNRTVLHLGGRAEARVRPYLALQNEFFLNVASRKSTPIYLIKTGFCWLSVFCMPVLRVSR
ncbi:MAG: DUF2490 domain-containing protein [Lewinellaceae bacterium]|nr:DUF2490 domain-containing protein [Lewinellaceae bacterium]